MTDMRPVGEMSMDSLQELAEKCSERNAVVRACREEGEMTLDAFLSRYLKPWSSMAPVHTVEAFAGTLGSNLTVYSGMASKV